MNLIDMPSPRDWKIKITFQIVEDFALKRLKILEILIKIKIEDNSNALAFVERTQPYLSKTLKEIRQDIISEENCCLKILSLFKREFQ